MASRPIRVTPATAAPAVPSTIHLRALRLRRARRERRKSLGVHTSARTRMNSLRLERVCSPSSASPSSIARRSRSSRSRDTSTGRCLVLGSALTSRMTSDLRPGALQRRADPAAAWSSSHVRCGHPPPINVRRCGSRRLRGNPPAAGPPLRSGPGAKQASLGCLSRRPPHFRARRRGNRPPPGHTKGPVSWLLSDQ